MVEDILLRELVACGHRLEVVQQISDTTFGSIEKDLLEAGKQQRIRVVMIQLLMTGLQTIGLKMIGL